MARPNHRTSHKDYVPNTGGIILCFAVLVPVVSYSTYIHDQNFNVLLSAFAVLLITGIIDDFNPIPVFYKFLGQFIPAIVIVSSFEPGDLLIPFVSIVVDLPAVFNYIFWILAIVLIMNAYNLIDGIDGLAIGLGIFASITFGIFFIQLGQPNLAIFAFSLAGALTGLLFYNLSRKHKIFIGDTGSLLLGGIIGYFALKYLNLNGPANLNESTYQALGILLIPLFDMLRVIVKRLSHGRSPFVADRNHIHHILLDRFRLSHLHTSLILVLFQSAAFTLLFFVGKSLSSGFLLYAVILVFVYFGIVHVLEQKKSHPIL
jgi:UDP-N-acetylmuramyl pentapeptide phosphotransferase/UDP-N-acetylglucosamine-1-phosphate transferase